MQVLGCWLTFSNFQTLSQQDNSNLHSIKFQVHMHASLLFEMGFITFHNAWCPPRDLIHIHTQFCELDTTESSVSHEFCKGGG